MISEKQHPGPTPGTDLDKGPSNQTSLMPSEDSQPRRGLVNSLFFRSVVAAAGLAIVLAMLGYFFHGRTGAEKTLTKLAMPLGALWLLLGGSFFQFLFGGQFRQSCMPGVLWLGLTLVSCGPLVDIWTRHMETRIPISTLSQQEPLDVIVVLGGGVVETPTRAQAGTSGDRVLYAAQLYHQGFTRRLLATGSAMDTIDGRKRKSPAELTIEIWTSLGIPREDILTLPGINTYSEIESVSQAMHGSLKNLRVGLLTSAWHLPRAMRLAHSRKLDSLVPIAADYRAPNTDYTFASFLPGAGALEDFAENQHEFMAGLVNR